MWRHNEWVTSFLHFLKTISIYTFFFEDVKYMYFLTSASACRITAWEHPEPRKFTSHHQHPALLLVFFSPLSIQPLLPPFSRTPRVSRARTRAKLRGNGCLYDRGGWAAWSERWAAWVCNVRHVGNGVLNQGGTAVPTRERDRQRAIETRACPALFALLRTQARPQSTGWLSETVTDSSMRTRGRPAVIPSRSNRFMLHLLL